MPSLPDFSIVIPTYNRPQRLRRLLSAIARLDYLPHLFEVIVVDDGGTKPLDRALKEFQDTLELFLLKQENRGPGAARNKGAMKAKGKYLAFTDDDCYPHPGWLNALANTFEKEESLLCGGITMNALPTNLYSATTQMLLDYLYKHYSPVEHMGGFFATNNLALSREMFLETGGFDPELRFGEDRDFCYRWASHGHPFAFVPDAVMYHAHQLTLGAFLKLHFCYGGGSYEFRRGVKKKGLQSVRLSPFSWYVNLAFSGIRKKKSGSGFLLTLLLIATQVASSIGFMSGFIRNQMNQKTFS
ncbi:MAG: glycosyltransferase [Deltaproteobacteria bacterium]|nr:glycosyltransferase [Deltaproteobacteria bacterium]